MFLSREGSSAAVSDPRNEIDAVRFGARQGKESSLPRVAPLSAFELPREILGIQVVSRSFGSRPEMAGVIFLERILL